jgi:hypothetical protein
MNIAIRNAAIKKLLVACYGKGNVCVTGGKGSSYGWVHVRFNSAQPVGVMYGDTKRSIVQACNEAGLYIDTYYDETFGSGDKLSIHWDS